MGKHWLSSGLSTGVLTGALILSGAVLPTPASAACSFMCGSGSGGSADPQFVADANAGTTNAIGPAQQQVTLAQLVTFLNIHIAYTIANLYRTDTIDIFQETFGTVSNESFGVGLAAGEETAQLTDNMSVWLSGSYSEAESTFTATAFTSETVSGAAGLDYAVSDFVTVGAMVSYAETDTVSAFNGGGSDSESYTIAPYALFIVDEMFSVDASIGYTRSDMENTRTIGGVVGRGKQDGDTMFFSGGLNAMKWYDRWGVGGRVGWAYSDTDNDSYTDTLGTTFAATTSQLGQLSIGGRVSYFADGYMPYLGATYKYDAISDDIITTTPLQPANDNDEITLEGGISLFSDGGFSGGLSGNYSVLREDYEAWGVGANIGFRF